MFQFFSEYSTHPAAMVVLAMIVMILKYYEKHYEKMAPLLFMAMVYISIELYPEMEEVLRRYLVRWSIWLLLVIEITSWLVRNKQRLLLWAEEKLGPLEKHK